MTRNRKVDPAVLEREYIFDSGTPPISLTQLSDKYGMARSGIADKARVGRWYERRIEFREQLGEKVVAALGDKWVDYETAQRQRMLDIAIKYMDKYAEALDSGEIKTTTRDMLGIAAMIRTLFTDVASSGRGEEELIDPDSKPLDPDYYRRALTTVEALLESGGNGSVDAGEAAEAGASGTGED